MLKNGNIKCIVFSLSHRVINKSDVNTEVDEENREIGIIRYDRAQQNRKIERIRGIKTMLISSNRWIIVDQGG